MAAEECQIQRIGEIAGKIWKTLDAEGVLSFAQLVKKVKEPRDAVMQGIGWLAREDKVCVVDEGRKRTVSLCE